jgi:hypothetical protein
MGPTHRFMLIRSERLGLYAASAPDRLDQAPVNLLTDVRADQRFREVPRLLADWMLVRDRRGLLSFRPSKAETTLLTSALFSGWAKGHCAVKIISIDFHHSEKLVITAPVNAAGKEVSRNLSTFWCLRRAASSTSLHRTHSRRNSKTRGQA